MSQPLLQFPTIFDYLDQSLKVNGRKIAFIFLNSEGDEVDVWTFRQLHEKISSIASNLDKIQVRGKRVVLFYPPGLEFIAAFLGTLRAGAVAVPIPAFQGKRQAERIKLVLRDADSRLVFTLPEIRNHISKSLGAVNVEDIEFIDYLEAIQYDATELPTIDPNALAFLQYTSGSTSNPKGVMISHQCLLANQQAIAEAFGHNESSSVVGWLPFYHDMGLIGNILQPIFLGATCILMAPLTFLRNPSIWLKTLSKYRATTSGGPNFAYQLCTNTIESTDIEGIDLSHWKVAFNGSEPVRNKTLIDFSEKFSSYGFNSNAHFPCYGLAESTLFVTGIKYGEPPRVIKMDAIHPTSTIEMVSCGFPRGTDQICIVDPITKEHIKSGKIGEIWVKGCSVAQGYWGFSQETSLTFGAYTEDGQGPFMRTGDLGLIDKGELFVSGRLKNMIIIRGRNYTPADLEFALKEGHDLLKNCQAAAFSVEANGDEILIIALELNRAVLRANVPDELIAAVKQTLAQEFGVVPADIVLLKPGSLPLTTSGKIQHHILREKYLGKMLSIFHSSKQLETQISKSTSLAAILNIPEIDIDFSLALSSHGLDSLKAVQIQSWMKNELGLVVSLEQLFDDIPLYRLIDKETPRSFLHSNIVETDEYAYHIPLSFNQEDLWVVHQLNPKSVAYNIPVVLQVYVKRNCKSYGTQSSAIEESQPVRFCVESEVSICASSDRTGSVLENRPNPEELCKNGFNELAFSKAIKRLIAKHEILRTHFPQKDSSPFQEFINEWTVPIVYIDVSDLPEHEQQSKFELVYADTILTPFSLVNELLIRIAVLKLAKDRTTIVMNFHHMLTDGYSMGILAKDLASFYNQEISDIKSAENLSVPYSTYVREQRSRNWQSTTNRWKKYLAVGNECPSISLSNYHKIPAKRGDEGKKIYAKTDLELTASLNSALKSYRCTMACILMAVYHSLLHIYTREQKIYVGFPAANRGSLHYRATVGYFVNTLVLKTEFCHEMTFLQVLDQVKAGLLFALENQDLPFQVLLDALKLPRQEGISPLFQTMFVMQNAPTKLDGFEGLEINVDNLSGYPVLYDLVLEVTEHDTELGLSFEYKVDCLPEQVVQNFSRDYLCLLRHVLKEPAIPILSLSLESAAKYKKDIYKESDTETPQSVFDLVEKQAKARPEDVAIIVGSEEMSYGQLLEKSYQAAYRLIEFDITLEEPIGCLLDRSHFLVPSILGIQKAGGVYVPLDPSYPEERLKTVIKAASINKIIYDPKFEYIIDFFKGEKINAAEIGHREPVALPKYDENKLAYLLFTSGSSGEPKGVMVEGKSLTNFILSGIQLFETTSIDRSLQFASLNWDTSSEEIYPCLAAGGTVVFRSNEIVEPYEDLLKMTEKHGITMWNFPTSYWHSLYDFLREKQLKLPRSLRLIVIGGEKANKRKISGWIKDYGAQVKLLNTYGATEATSISAAIILNDWDTLEDEVPIGKEIGNGMLLVLNNQFSEVPPGVSGELYIAGKGIARGYLNLPELNTKKFVYHPYTNERLFKTGDIAYYGLDGNLYLNGREDTQIKRRGFRVELEEVQSLIERLSEVKECKVRVVNDLLRAYVLTRQTQTSSQIREKLAKICPSYMIPDCIDILIEFPKLSNGKVDLIALDTSRSQEIGGNVTSEKTTDLENEVCSLWVEILGHSNFRISDSFFAVGGNSLLIIKLHSRLNEKFGTSILISDLFRYHTCDAQTRLVEEQHELNKSSSKLDILLKLSEGTIDLETAKKSFN